MDDRITSLAASKMLRLSNAYLYILVSECHHALKNGKVLCLNGNPIPFVEYTQSCLTLPHQRPIIYYFSHAEIRDYISKRDDAQKKVKSKIKFSSNLDLYNSIIRAYNLIHGEVLQS